MILFSFCTGLRIRSENLQALQELALPGALTGFILQNTLFLFCIQITIHLKNMSGKAVAKIQELWKMKMALTSSPIRRTTGIKQGCSWQHQQIYITGQNTGWRLPVPTTANMLINGANLVP